MLNVFGMLRKGSAVLLSPGCSGCCLLATVRNFLNFRHLKKWVREFYCDPNAAWQKPHVEKSHTTLRKILEHDTRFDSLTQEDVSHVASHLNSMLRKEYGNAPAMDRFV